MIERLLPWLERERDQKTADQEKALELIQAITHERVSGFLDDLYNALYRREDFALLDEFREFSLDPNNRFFRQKLQGRYVEFKESFSVLSNFTATHFFVNRNNTNILQLYPELQESNPELYTQRLTELRELIRLVREKHLRLITCAREKYIGCFSFMLSVFGLLLLALVIFLVVSGAIVIESIKFGEVQIFPSY